ncbi:hypothetical protein IK146_01595 [Candidatus Saccharibacteria bacterium]|nr:hypothetical protein [Candidatus Saccharibacteria bacterium]
MPQNKQQTSLRRHRPFYKQPLFFFVIIIVVAALLYLAFRQPMNPSTDTVTNSNPDKRSSGETQETTQSSNMTEADPSTTDSVISSDGKTPEKYEGTDPNTYESLTGSITTARFDGDKLLVRVAVDQFLSNGTCKLTLSDGAHQLEKTANLVPIASTSTCEGFDVQSSELDGFARPISINISLTSGERTGSITGSTE